MSRLDEIERELREAGRHLVELRDELRASDAYALAEQVQSWAMGLVPIIDEIANTPWPKVPS